MIIIKYFFISLEQPKLQKLADNNIVFHHEDFKT